ncbi:hypothetical protein niasHT_014455 [Heterodera trifolii]|uniref:Secreted protein n=1 Tax=Heterodera trifolii TaxID=157864 RepID=A0ABD2KZG8_9BILA
MLASLHCLTITIQFSLFFAVWPSSQTHASPELQFFSRRIPFGIWEVYSSCSSVEKTMPKRVAKQSQNLGLNQREENEGQTKAKCGE